MASEAEFHSAACLDQPVGALRTPRAAVEDGW